jgi:hypothetical protein
MFRFPVGKVVTVETTDDDISDVSISISADLPLRSERLSVSSLPFVNYYLPSNIYYSDDPIMYSSVYRNVSYLDINSDKELQKKSTRFYYSQLYNRYIPDSNSEILDFVKLGSKDISLVKSMKEAKNNRTDEEDYGEKINYLADYVFSKTDVFSTLYDFVSRRRINWWDLKYYSDQLESILINKVKTKIRDMLME